MANPDRAALIAWTAVFSILVPLSLFLRFLCLSRKPRPIRGDDFLVVLATASMLAMEASMCWAMRDGFGNDEQTLTPPQVSTHLKLLYSVQFTWTIATASCKMAMLFLYVFLFPTRLFRLTARMIMALTVVFALAIMLPMFFLCRPISAFWNPHPGKCMALREHQIAAISMNVFLDVLIVLLPIPIIWNVRMPIGKKTGVSFMFSLGLLVVALMLWRMIATVIPRSDSIFGFNFPLLYLQTCFELWVGLIVANLVASLPILSQLAPKRVSQYFSRMSQSSSGGSENSLSQLKRDGESVDMLVQAVPSPLVEQRTSDQASDTTRDWDAIGV